MSDESAKCVAMSEWVSSDKATYCCSVASQAKKNEWLHTMIHEWSKVFGKLEVTYHI